MFRTLLAMTLLLVGPFALRNAYADSDGYYCVGRHYLAYQFGFATPPAGPHHLYVLRFDSSPHVEAPIAFDLPQFQVHGMRCHDRSIELGGWDALYTVYLDAANRPVRYETRGRNPAQLLPPEFYATANLGGWSRAAKDLKATRVPLATLSAGGTLQLEIRVRPNASEPCLSRVTTRVVRLDRNRREVERRQIFQGRAMRECGE